MALEVLCDYNKHDNGAAGLGNVFQLPDILSPQISERVDFGKYKKDESGRDINLHFDHGTTTLGFKYQNGIVLAVDSRATGGQYIGSRTVKKVIKINDYLLGTIAGGAADCQYWDRILTKQCRLYELRNRTRISVAAASKIMANTSYNYKGTGLSMGMMLAGWDKSGSHLFYIDSDASRSRNNFYSVGSGSVYAYGVIDSGYKWDLTDEEAYELGQKAIYHATFRDSYSGGTVRVYHMKETGFVHVSDTDCMDLHSKFANNLNQTAI